ncbi:hypothetical protein JGY85_15360 [Shigella sonnei]|nr:hypothetical protein [Shigella sonnei]
MDSYGIEASGGAPLQRSQRRGQPVDRLRISLTIMSYDSQQMSRNRWPYIAASVPASSGFWCRQCRSITLPALAGRSNGWVEHRPPSAHEELLGCMNWQSCWSRSENGAI